MSQMMLAVYTWVVLSCCSCVALLGCIKQGSDTATDYFFRNSTSIRDTSCCEDFRARTLGGYSMTLRPIDQCTVAMGPDVPKYIATALCVTDREGKHLRNVLLVSTIDSITTSRCVGIFDGLIDNAEPGRNTFKKLWSTRKGLVIEHRNTRSDEWAFYFRYDLRSGRNDVVTLYQGGSIITNINGVVDTNTRYDVITVPIDTLIKRPPHTPLMRHVPGELRQVRDALRGRWSFYHDDRHSITFDDSTFYYNEDAKGKRSYRVDRVRQLTNPPGGLARESFGIIIGGDKSDTVWIIGADHTGLTLFIPKQKYWEDLVRGTKQSLF